MIQCPKMQKMVDIAFFKIRILETWGLSLVNFGLRLWLANIFWSSGITKIATDTAFGFIPYFYITELTVDLFSYEYNVPFLNPVFAAWAGTLVELLMPILLAVGLMSRSAAVILLVQIAVIQYVFPEFGAEHLIWAMVAAVILTSGPGRISIDHFIRKYFEK